LEGDVSKIYGVWGKKSLKIFRLSAFYILEDFKNVSELIFKQAD